MATSSSVQGFITVANLQENELDRQAINNLATSPIADDISLFINNLKNESRIEIKAEEYDRIEGLVTIVNTTSEESQLRSAVFTNKDRVRIERTNGTVIADNLYIARSNGETIFSFATNESLTNEYVFAPTENFVVVRNDSVTLDAISFLGAQESTASLSTGLGTGENANEGSSVDLTNSYANRFGEIYEYLDIAKFLAKSKFVNDQNVAANVDFAMEGTFTIRDPADTIINEGVGANSPGLYITDPGSPVTNIQKIRAFSDTFNPWEDNVTKLTTQAISATAGDLKLNQGLTVTGVTPLTESGNVSNVTFTHKIKVNVDGIDYFLCLTQ
jgi:hypothetical protein